MMGHFEHLDTPALELDDVPGDIGDQTKVTQHDSRNGGVVPGVRLSSQ